MNDNIDISFINNIDNISTNDWLNLNSSNCPFIKHEFFSALEKSLSVSAKQGWQPHHLVVKTENELSAVMPMYLKSHSWGEYVFDWEWADFFKRNGIDYYPKLVATLPFTPVFSEKILSSKFILNDVIKPLIAYCQNENISSWHILYCDELQTNLSEDVYQRHTVQFHWFNRDYNSFDDFINTFTSRKRKNTRKERQSIIHQGITIRQLKNKEISQNDLKFFYLTYQLTYLKRGHQPHLSYEFFKQIVASMSDNVLLIIASDAHEDVACALFFYDDTQLYGRYWGCTKQIDNLHFELCYYRGIEFCIDNELTSFNPGTQGEHKIQRGFEPVLTHSYHWINHPLFKGPIKDFCQKEQEHMLIYQRQCRQMLPFKMID